MTPLIRDGDLLTVAPIENAPLRLGDVVAFMSPRTGRLVSHRIVAFRPEGCLVQGDRCPQPDGVLRPEKLLGRVTRIRRGSRRIRLGLGPERLLIARLARRGLLYHILHPLWRLVRPLIEPRP
jgi:hypothetical protein